LPPVGTMTATASVQVPGSGTRALERSAMLRQAGADLQAITYNVFRNKRFEALKLWGFAFSRLVRESRGQLVWTELRAADVAAAEAKDEDVSGLVVQIARSIWVSVARQFTEKQSGRVVLDPPV